MMTGLGVSRQKEPGPGQRHCQKGRRGVSNPIKLAEPIAEECAHPPGIQLLFLLQRRIWTPRVEEWTASQLLYAHSEQPAWQEP